VSAQEQRMANRARVETWSLIKTTFQPVDIPAAALVVSRWCGMPRAEAAGRLRASRGILLRRLLQPAAENSARELTEVGIPALAVPDSATMPFPRPYILRRAGAAADAFLALREPAGTESSLPWSGIQVVAAGRVTEKHRHTEAPSFNRRWELARMAARAASVRIPPGSSTRSPGAEETVVRDWLYILGGDPLQTYAVDGRGFNYASVLPRPAPIAEANFCHLVIGVLRMAASAATNILSRQIGRDGSLALEVFESSHDFDQLLGWLLAISRVGLWPAAALDRGAGQTDDESAGHKTLIGHSTAEITRAIDPQ